VIDGIGKIRDAEELRGWYPDPFNLHELRYFSMDGKPIRLVSIGGSGPYQRRIAGAVSTRV
jgi:hypothetical protein